MALPIDQEILILLKAVETSNRLTERGRTGGRASLDLSGTKVTARQAAKLKHSLGTCEITR